MTNHRPNVEQAARDLLDDLGLIVDDRTEGLRALQARAVPEAWIDQHERRGLKRVGSTP